MDESWEDLLCRVYRAGYEDRQRERDYDPMGSEVVDQGRRRANAMEKRIRELDDALKVARRVLYFDEGWPIGWNISRIDEVLEGNHADD